MRRLLLMRHGKAASPHGVEDFERPLADAGRLEAAAAGAWIAEHVGPVDAVLCSPARRTRETLAATGVHAPATFPDEIYEAWTGDLLDVVRSVDAGAGTVLLVGHSPGTPSLAARLAGEDSDPALVNRVRACFPTATVAVLEPSTGWAELDPGTARLADLFVPH